MREALPQKQGRSHKILIVDDNIDCADMLGEALAIVGHDVAVAYDGQEALRQQLVFKPDVAVVDIALPAMDGCELAVRLRGATASPLCLIALSGFGGIEDRQHTSEAGFQAHLLKPIDLRALCDCIERLELARK
jgi:DNA-binding response OmpR family regulator